jgi:hypothetical protein
MRGEIEEAARLGKEIRVFNKDILNDAIAIVNGIGNDKSRIEYDSDHSYLSLPANAIIPADRKGVEDVV